MGEGGGGVSIHLITSPTSSLMARPVCTFAILTTVTSPTSFHLKNNIVCEFLLQGFLHFPPPPPIPYSSWSSFSTILQVVNNIPGQGLSGHGHNLECPLMSASFSCSQVLESKFKIEC